MEKWLCWGSLGISGFLLLLFVLDMTLPNAYGPFGGIGMFVNIVGIIGCVLVAYLAWDTFKDWR